MRSILALLPYTIRQRVKKRFCVPDMRLSLERMRRHGFAPRVAIDIGAFEGEWTRMAVEVFPGLRVLMVEPQASKRPLLERVVAEIPGTRHEQVLLGARVQDRMRFHEIESASSVLDEHVNRHDVSTYLPMTTLDRLTAGSDFSSPDLLKLDVQGYELEVLRGAETLLRHAEVVILEVSLLGIHVGVPLFAEVVAFMAQRAFRVYDIPSFFRRPFDDALFQVDLIFVAERSPLVASHRWD